MSFRRRALNTKMTHDLRRWMTLCETSETLELPTIEIGDTVLVGKWKNRKAEIKGFTADQHNQPVLKTNKGDQKLFKPRIAKLMDHDLRYWLALCAAESGASSLI
jgi:hypothetical protein